MFQALGYHFIDFLISIAIGNYYLKIDNKVTMSNQRDEDFDSIYASIDDDDDEYAEEMYVDVSSTSPQTTMQGGPSPYVYPSSPQPPSLSVRKLPSLPPKPTAEASSKPPWPRQAPKPPANETSYKAATVPKAADPNRNAPCPLPRAATVRKKDGDRPPLDKSRYVVPQQKASKTGYNPPPSVIPSNRQGVNQGGNYSRGEVSAVARYQGTEGTNLASLYSQGESQSQHGYAKQLPPAQRKLPFPPPPDSAPPPPPNRTTYGEEIYDGTNIPVSEYTLNNTPRVEEEYEFLRPAKQRLKRGYGQRSRRSRRYSSDQIPLQDMAEDTDERHSNGGRQKRKEKRKEGGGDVQNKSDNSKAVCILLTIIVVALLISLLSLAMSLYTLTKFELYLRSNDTVPTECDIKVTNCTTDVSNLECKPVS